MEGNKLYGEVIMDIKTKNTEKEIAKLYNVNESKVQIIDTETIKNRKKPSPKFILKLGSQNKDLKK